MEEPKIGILGKGLTHYHTTIFSKMKESADDNFKFDENGRKLSKRVENTVEKGEIARYERFLLFPQCFQKACFLGASKGVTVWEWVKSASNDGLSFLMDWKTYRGYRKVLFTSSFCFPTKFSTHCYDCDTPTKEVGGAYWSHCPSVCLCITKSCQGHNFKSIKASNSKLHTQIGHIVEKCSVQ